MALIKKVTLLAEQKCNSCKQLIPAGAGAIKDRRFRKQTNNTFYYHTEGCKIPKSEFKKNPKLKPVWKYAK
jgi:hypothetical protein